MPELYSILTGFGFGLCAYVGIVLTSWFFPPGTDADTAPGGTHAYERKTDERRS